MGIIRPLSPLDHSEMWLGRGREDSKISEFNVSLRTMSGGFQRQRRAVRKITATLTPTCAAFIMSESREPSWKSLDGQDESLPE